MPALLPFCVLTPPCDTLRRPLQFKALSLQEQQELLIATSRLLTGQYAAAAQQLHDPDIGHMDDGEVVMQVSASGVMGV